MMIVKNLFAKAKEEFRRSRREILICTAFLLLIAFLLYFAVSTFVPLLRGAAGVRSEQDLITDYLREEGGVKGCFALAALQVLQVISVFLPGMAVQVAGGLIYGAWVSFFICLVSFVFANVMMFYLCRHSRLLSRLLPENAKSVRTVSDWVNSNDAAFMSMLAYMLPGIPNGFVPYVAAKAHIRARRFALSVLLGSVLQIFLNCAIGSLLTRGHWLLSALLILFMLAMIFVLYRNKEQLIRLRDKCTALWARLTRRPR